MRHIKHLEDLLQRHFCWHKSRVKFMSLFMIALIKVRTVNLTQLALALNPLAKSESNYRRLQRFFALFEVSYDNIARFIMRLLPIQNQFVLTLDRTNWKLGRANINLLVLGIANKGIAFPILWSLLDKRGNSNTAERIDLMDQFIRLFGKGCIKYLVADREFIGNRWIAYLKEKGIRFSIRIRANAQVSGHKGKHNIDQSFQHLKLQQFCCLSKTRRIYGQKLRVAAMRIKDDFIILITNHLPERALLYYKERWQIETLFASLKSRGFDFEQTHITDQERIKKLMGLLAITFCWAHLVGEWRNSIKPITIKTHKRPQYSIFRYGLDFLREIILNIQFRKNEFIHTVKLLSCT